MSPGLWSLGTVNVAVGCATPSHVSVTSIWTGTGWVVLVRTVLTMIGRGATVAEL